MGPTFTIDEISVLKSLLDLFLFSISSVIVGFFRKINTNKSFFFVDIFSPKNSIGLVQVGLKFKDSSIHPPEKSRIVDS